MLSKNNHQNYNVQQAAVLEDYYDVKVSEYATCSSSVRGGGGGDYNDRGDVGDDTNDATTNNNNTTISLICQNDSYCMEGNLNRDYMFDQVRALEMTTSHELDNTIFPNASIDGYHCRCLYGYTGVDCSVPYKSCRNPTKNANNTINGQIINCYHGGTCQYHSSSRTTSNTTNSPEIHLPTCDCTTANHNGQVYTGQYCEKIVSEDDFCNHVVVERDGHDVDIEIQQDNNNNDQIGFCLNGGTCKKKNKRESDENNIDDNAGYDCDCPIGYIGTHCEYEIPLPPESERKHMTKDDIQDTYCDLPCYHGGTCVRGDYMLDNPDRAQIRIEYFGGTTTPKPGMYCSCPQGYDGLQCEYRVQVCGLHGPNICLHGTVCVKDIDEHDDTAYRCECPPSSKNNSNNNNLANATNSTDGYDDDFCYLRTEYCSPQNDNVLEYVEGMAVPAFCVNGGKCKDVVIDGKVHPGCDCHDPFYGPHCEFLKLGNQMIPSDAIAAESKPSVSASVHEQHRFRKPGLISFGILAWLAMAAVAYIFGSRWLRRRQARVRRTKHEQNMNMNLHSIRDEDNPVALSANGNMLFPSMGDARSFNVINGGGGGRSPNGNMLFPASSPMTFRTPTFGNGNFHDHEFT